MKKLNRVLTLLILLTISAQSFAQTPQKFKYQAVCRDNLGNIIAGQAVSLRLTIHDVLPGGLVLYKETHTATTNNFGLVTLAVGGGTVDTGNFAAIPWGTGDKYLEVELNTGSGFNSVGTSQLLSVPYALYAEQANVPGLPGSTGTQGLTGPQGPTGNDGAIGVTGPQGPTGNNGATGATGPQGPSGNNGAVGATGQQGPSGGYPVHYISESYGGGIVFYVYDGGQHGLIAATTDQSTGIRWYGGSYTNTRARADGIGAGLKNTAIIIANQGPIDGNAFAATVCNEYSVTVGVVTYGDWYLPSKYELNLLYLQKGVVGGFANDLYWSSTEDNNTSAWAQVFNAGLQVSINKNFTYYVRAVRAF
jgi:hypothetical protein